MQLTVLGSSSAFQFYEVRLKARQIGLAKHFHEFQFYEVRLKEALK
mgnify:CR=1 FL=1